MTSKSKVSIIILNYNGRRYLGELLDKALESALNQTYRNIEVIFADNGSRDGSVEYVREKYGGRIKIVGLRKNYGFCLGNNLAARYSSPEAKYLLFMNPDVILDSDYVAKLLNILENNDKIAIIQGLEKRVNGYERVGGTLDVLGGAVDFPPGERGQPPLKHVLIVSGAAMLIRRDVFENVGGFSPELFLYYDEADLGIRVRSLGYEAVGTTETSFTHYVSGVTSKVSETAWYFMNRNRWLIILRYYHGVRFIYALIWNALLALANLTIRGYRERFRVRLTLHMIGYIARNIKREITIRIYYKKYRNKYEYFIVCKANKK